MIHEWLHHTVASFPSVEVEGERRRRMIRVIRLWSQERSREGNCHSQRINQLMIKKYCNISRHFRMKWLSQKKKEEKKRNIQRNALLINSDVLVEIVLIRDEGRSSSLSPLHLLHPPHPCLFSSLSSLNCRVGEVVQNSATLEIIYELSLLITLE